jgi:hypothetical protein
MIAKVGTDAVERTTSGRGLLLGGLGVGRPGTHGRGGRVRQLPVVGWWVARGFGRGGRGLGWLRSWRCGRVELAPVMSSRVRDQGLARGIGVVRGCGSTSAAGSGGATGLVNDGLVRGVSANEWGLSEAWHG